MKKGHRPSRSATSSYWPWIIITGTVILVASISGWRVSRSTCGPVGDFVSTSAADLAKASMTTGSLTVSGVMELKRSFQPCSVMRI